MGMVGVEGKGAVLEVDLGCPIVINADFATQLLPNYFRQNLYASVVLLKDRAGDRKCAGPDVISEKLVRLES